MYQVQIVQIFCLVIQFAPLHPKMHNITIKALSLSPTQVTNRFANIFINAVATCANCYVDLYASLFFILYVFQINLCPNPVWNHSRSSLNNSSS